MGSPAVPAGASATIVELIHRFEELGTEARHYSEARAVNEFIMPLFAALGWDVRSEHTHGEVVPEERVSRGRVDWAFRLRGVPVLYLEAKKPGTNLDDPAPAHQAINYAYNKGVAWAILTNFESLRLYNAEWDAPNPNLNLFFEIGFGDYATDPRMSWLSRGAMAAGVLDAEATKVGKRLRKTPVGDQLFEDMLTYRSMLRVYFAAYNEEVAPAEIDHAVQRLLDRLIFIRTAEDRHIEEQHLRPLVRRLREANRLSRLWPEVLALFREFDGHYDSQLFARQRLDELDTEHEPIRVAIEGLYGTRNGSIEYDFGAIDADVLGGAYEQYLGQLARAVPMPRARLQVEDALRQAEHADTRRFRKAHGVYYTPKWVVRLIVETTLGRALHERTPEEIRNIRVLDPACGSGSFLVEAFRLLASYWRRTEPPVDSAAERAQRVAILQANIFGVDLDPSAVEIAQLNLLLVALSERSLLPDLAANVVCGNSLVDRDRADAFDYPAAFPFAQEPGRFDVVIGNPPYVRSQNLPALDREIFRARYRTAVGSFDIYELFLERALELARLGGRTGFIVPGKFLSSSSGEATLLDHIYDCANIEVLVDAMRFRVFEDALTYPVILVARRGATPAGYQLGRVVGLGPVGPTIEWEELTERVEPTLADHELPDGWTTVGSLARVSQALVTGADNVFGLHGAWREPTVRLHSDSLDRIVEVESGLLRPLVSGSQQVSRFRIATPEDWLLFPYRDGRLIPEETMKGLYPLTWAYLEANRARLESRDGGEMAGPRWYGYSRAQALTSIWAPKVLVPYMSDHARAAADPAGTIAIVNVTTGGYFAVPHDNAHLAFLTAALNSQHAGEWWREHATPHAGGYFGLTSRAISLLPIPDPATLAPEVLAAASTPTGPDDDPFGRALALHLAPQERTVKGASGR
jgi:methylase of polypeptide subunit release factors